MNTLFSILYVPISATLEEKVSIGLIMSDGEQHFFKYSQSKLQAIKGLLDNESLSILKAYLKSLEKEINVIVTNENKLFSMDIPSKANWINSSYISYLSRYSNNLIQFSAPKSIDITLTESTYKRVFEKYIFQYNTIVSQENTPDIYVSVKTKLYPRITGKVNIDRTLTSDDFENLFAPVEVNFIGVNGVPCRWSSF